MAAQSVKFNVMSNYRYQAISVKCKSQSAYRSSSSQCVYFGILAVYYRLVFLVCQEFGVWKRDGASLKALSLLQAAVVVNRTAHALMETHTLEKLNTSFKALDL